MLLVLGGILCSVTSGGMVCVLACCIWHIEHAGMRQGQRMMTAVCGGRGIGGVPEAGVIFRVLGDMVATDMGRCITLGRSAFLWVAGIVLEK